MAFEFATATRIIFGAGTLRELGAVAAELGRRALIVTGRGSERLVPLLQPLTAQGVDYLTFHVSEEPTVALLAQGIKYAEQARPALVIGYGGGSALDAGKALAALFSNGADPLDFLEGIGRGKPLARPSLPYIAIPTTAGTGAEVTRNAVIGSPEHGVKVSLRSPSMLPRVAIVDPELTYSLPPEVTARTGLDALTQLIEPYVSNRANPLTDLLCQDGIRRAARSLLRAYEQGADAAAREDMALASLYSGMALANARLGAVHGLAGPLGGAIPAPHGTICARLLPIVMDYNLRALREREPGSEALRRYDEVARLLTGSAAATADDGLAWLRELRAALHIPALADYGLSTAQIPELVPKAARANSMQGNPVKLTPEELTAILEEAL